MKTIKSRFTLMELLVLLLVVLLVAALVVPTFSPPRTSRERARQIFCISNLKQIALCASLYSQDYDDTLPLIQEHYSQKYINPLTPGDSWYGLLNTFVENERTFVCPSDKAMVNAKGLMGDDERFRLSYGFNAVSDATSAASYGTWCKTAPKMETVVKPETTLMVADAGETHGVLYPHAGKRREEYGHLALRHYAPRGFFRPKRYEFNIVFFDGHAECFQRFTSPKPEQIKLGQGSTAY